MSTKILKSVELRYDEFIKDALNLLEDAGLARPDQIPKIVGRAFYKASVALAAIHFPDDKEIEGIGPRGLIWNMHSAVEGPSIKHKDPEPVSAARSVALVIKNVIKNRPALDLIEESKSREGLIIDSTPTNPKKKNEIDDNLCFIIMSFSKNDALNEFYTQSIKPTIENCGYRCERVDEQEFNNSIRNEIMRNIWKAKFIVADMTEAKPNCYYELGVAHSLEKKVIHLAKSVSDIHFNVADFNFIFYSKNDEFTKILEKRVIETVGKYKIPTSN